MSKNRAAVFAVIVLMTALAVGFAFLGLLSNRQLERRRTLAVEIGTERAHELERRIDQLFASTSTLATFLRQGGTVTDFEALAADLVRNFPIASAVLLAPDGGLVRAYPEAAEEREVVDEALAEAAATAGPRLAGPWRLPSSGTAFLAVVPVERAPDGGAWGHVLASVRVEELRALAELDDLLAAEYDFRLARIDPGSGRERTFVRSTELELTDPVRQTIAVSGGRWVLEVAPRQGWPSPWSKHLELVVVALLSLLASLFAYDLAKKPERLERQMEKRSRRLERTREQLSREIRQRELVEARETWRGLDRFAQLALVAVRDGESTEEGICRTVSRTLQGVGMDYKPAEIVAGLSRLEEQALLRRTDGGRLEVVSSLLLKLPEARKSLADLARDTMERIGAYRIERRLGGGGMGEVFRSVNVHDSSPAAVKLLYPQAMNDPEQRQRFEREAAIVSELNHPNIVRLLERGEHRGRLYIAMELVDGETLSEILARGPLPVPKAVAVLEDVARALAVLHNLGVVHRDIKASNVMRTASGRAVLLDFGLASGLTSHTITRSDAVIGTLPYMPPERLTGSKGDASSDIWAAGLIFYEMVVGTLPWEDSSQYSLVSEILGLQPAEVASRLLPLIGPELTQLLREMLAPLPEDRLPSGEFLLRRLFALRGSLPHDDDTAPKTPKRDPGDVPPTVTLRHEPAYEPTVKMPKTGGTDPDSS